MQLVCLLPCKLINLALLHVVFVSGKDASLALHCCDCRPNLMLLLEACQASRISTTMQGIIAQPACQRRSEQFCHAFCAFSIRQSIDDWLPASQLTQQFELTPPPGGEGGGCPKLSAIVKPAPSLATYRNPLCNAGAQEVATLPLPDPVASPHTPPRMLPWPCKPTGRAIPSLGL